MVRSIFSKLDSSNIRNMLPPNPLPCVAAHQLQSPLFRLPAETRNEIFSLALPYHANLISFSSQVKLKADLANYRQSTSSSGSLKRKANARHGKAPLQSLNALSLTCRLAYQETIDSFYHNNTFRVYDTPSLRVFTSRPATMQGFYIQRLRIDRIDTMNPKQIHRTRSRPRSAIGPAADPPHIDPELLGLIKHLPNLRQLNLGALCGRPWQLSHHVALELMRFLRRLGMMLKNLDLVMVDTTVPLDFFHFGKEQVQRLHSMGDGPHWKRWFQTYSEHYGVETGPFDENAVMMFEPIRANIADRPNLEPRAH